MMQGVANLVANQESANYGPNYHARSDEYGRPTCGSCLVTRRRAIHVWIARAAETGKV